MHRTDYRLASLATVPARAKELPITLASLAPQVDELCVYLNGHTKVPECVRDLGCSYAFGRKLGNRGDGGKFYWADEYTPGPHTGSPPWREGRSWRLTCDDDFLYTPHYVEKQIDAAMRLRAPVSLHGVVLSDDLAAGKDVGWLKKGRKHWLRAIDKIVRDVPVHILGTGVACYHTDMVEVKASDFLVPHSADIWFAALCQKQGVRRYVWAHPSKLATQICPPLGGGPVTLRRGGEYSRRVAALAPWSL